MESKIRRKGFKIETQSRKSWLTDFDYNTSQNFANRFSIRKVSLNARVSSNDILYVKSKPRNSLLSFLLFLFLLTSYDLSRSKRSRYYLTRRSSPSSHSLRLRLRFIPGSSDRDDGLSRCGLIPILRLRRGRWWLWRSAERREVRLRS